MSWDSIRRFVFTVCREEALQGALSVGWEAKLGGWSWAVLGGRQPTLHAVFRKISVDRGGTFWQGQGRQETRVRQFSLEDPVELRTQAVLLCDMQLGRK